VKTFSKLIHIYPFYNDFSAPLAMALCGKHCIFETAALICVCGASLESLLNGPMGDKFISAEAQ